jgi:hypothetical protein
VSIGCFLVTVTLVAWRLVAVYAVAVAPASELVLVSTVPLFEPLSAAAK